MVLLRLSVTMVLIRLQEVELQYVMSQRSNLCVTRIGIMLLLAFTVRA